jgi:hypothetical protein
MGSHFEIQLVNLQMIDHGETSAHWQLQLQLAELGLFVMPCLASFVPEYTRSRARILSLLARLKSFHQVGNLPTQ